jgi:hypothetical protein
MWDLWLIKWQWSRFSPCILVSPTNSHSTKCSIIICHLGPVVADVPRGLSLITPQETKEKETSLPNIKKQTPWLESASANYAFIILTSKVLPNVALSLKLLPCRAWRRIIWLKFIDLSQEHSVCIFEVEAQGKPVRSKKQTATSVILTRITRCHIPEPCV